MYEVESKVRAPHGAVRKRLSQLHAEHRGQVTQVDTYYDAPDRDFAETDEALRVRREETDGGSRVLLTYKGPLVDDKSKTREEAETRISNETALRDILAGLDYEPAATVHKERDRYTLAGCVVTLDDVEHLGEFVEVEYQSPVEADQVDTARTTVTETLERLGLDADATIQTSYLGLLLDTE